MDEFFEKLLELIRALLDLLFICACALCFIRHVVALSLIFSLLTAHPDDVLHLSVERYRNKPVRFYFFNDRTFRINHFDQYFVSFNDFPRVKWDRITWTTYISFRRY